MRAFLPIVALTAGAFAAVEERQIVTDSLGFSVLSVLATALPPSDISLATANPAQFSADLMSSLKAGTTPQWYQALPSDVKSYLPKLYPASYPASTTPVATSATSMVSSVPMVMSTGAASGTAPVGTGTGAPSGGNVTVISTVSSATLASTGGANSGAGSSASGTVKGSSASTGGASYPTAVVGAGLAGVIGFLGMLAL